MGVAAMFILENTKEQLCTIGIPGGLLVGDSMNVHRQGNINRPSAMSFMAWAFWWLKLGCNIDC